MACSELEDEASPGPVPLRIHNTNRGAHEDDEDDEYVPMFNSQLQPIVNNIATVRRCRQSLPR